MITLVATLALLTAAQQTDAVAATPVSELQGLHDFGTCLARDRSKAGALLGAVPGTTREGEVMVDLVKKGCPDIDEFTLDPALLRGIVAEAMFQRDFGSLDTTHSRRPAVAVFEAPSADQLAGLPRGTQHSVGMIAYARCVLDQAPQQIMALFRTAPGSASEGTAFSALGPTLGPCLPEGMKVEFTRPQLRGALAEAAYRAAAAK
jgi:hypothetical protein